MKKWKKHFRTTVQLGFFALTNANLKGFFRAEIYRGKLKHFCVPGLNCYSCPGALGACPLGALQSSIAVRQFPYYILGLMILFGALLGRWICGWVCPFGLAQDLLYKIPFPGKKKLLPGDRWLKYLKYFVLAGFVILLPLLALDIAGQGTPWFCKYICPSGTLFAGIPLAAGSETIREGLGGLFYWKVGLLGAVAFGAVIAYRPFCRIICPLGAIYSLFQPVSLYRYRVNEKRCTACGACEKACGFEIRAWEQPNSLECIRCGACKKACPQGAITSGFVLRCKQEREL